MSKINAIAFILQPLSKAREEDKNMVRAFWKCLKKKKNRVGGKQKQPLPLQK